MTGDWRARALGALALLCVGLGAASCETKEPVEPPPAEEVLPRLDVLREKARMLGVDAQQRFLVFTDQTDAGTFAKVLPGGQEMRICDPAAGAFFAEDGSAVLLWGTPDGTEDMTWWLWRPGINAGIPLTTLARGNAVHDRSLSYVAFAEYDAGAGTSSLRVIDAATCTPRTCASRTLFQVPGATLNLQGGGASVLATDATQAWLVDVHSGAVTALGPVAGPPALSPNGAHAALFSAGGRLQVFDTATRTLQWERPWSDEVSRKDWVILSSLITDAANVVFNIREPPPPPPAFPTYRDAVTCDATGCRVLPGDLENCGYLANRRDVVRCSSYYTCRPQLCDGTENYNYFDARMQLLANFPASSRYGPVDPVFNEDLSQQVRRERGTTTDALLWWGPAGFRRVEPPGAVLTKLLTLMPGSQRVVFADRKSVV